MPLPDRRDWLRLSAAALAGAALPRRASAADAPFPLGFSLYGMKGLKTAEALKVCAEVGFDCVELALMPGYPTEPKLLSADDRRELRKRLADSRLTVAALMENLPEPPADTVHRANLDRLKAAAELGHALAPDAPPVVETILGGKPADWDAVKDRLAERVRAWAEVGRASKTVIAVKPHVANAMHTPDAALWLLKQVGSPWVRLAFDHSHFALRGRKLADTAAALAKDSAFVHVKCARGKPEKFEFLLPGDGDTDYREYANLLRQHGYRGPVVVEVSGQVFSKPGYDPVAAAKKTFAALAPAFRTS